MPGAGTPVHGIECRFMVNATFINFDKWEVQAKADTPEAFGFEDYDVVNSVLGKRNVVGAKQATITAKGYWDAANNPNANPINLVDGMTLTNCFAWVRRLGTRRWSFPELLVVSVHIDGDVAKRVDIDVQLLTQGTYTYPV